MSLRAAQNLVREFAKESVPVQVKGSLNQTDAEKLASLLRATGAIIEVHPGGALQQEPLSGPRRVALSGSLGEPLSPLSVSILLRPGERGYFEEPALYGRLQTDGKFTGFGFGVSMPAGQGSRVRMSRYRGGQNKKLSLRPMDRVLGKVCVTSRRIVFVGKERSIEIPAGRVIQVEHFKQGLLIKSEGVAVFHRGHSGPEIFLFNERLLRAGVVSRFKNSVARFQA